MFFSAACAPALGAARSIWGESSPWNSLNIGMVWSGWAVRLELEVHQHSAYIWLEREVGEVGRASAVLAPVISLTWWPCTKAGAATRDVSTSADGFVELLHLLLRRCASDAFCFGQRFFWVSVLSAKCVFAVSFCFLGWNLCLHHSRELLHEHF